MADPNRLVHYFAYDHLPTALQPVSKVCQALAEAMDRLLPESAEKTAGLRHLLEAKDCFVRAAVDDLSGI